MGSSPKDVSEGSVTLWKGRKDETEPLPYGLCGMPEEYTADEEELADKEKARENRMAEASDPLLIE